MSKNETDEKLQDFNSIKNLHRRSKSCNLSNRYFDCQTRTNKGLVVFVKEYEKVSQVGTLQYYGKYPT